MLDIPQTAAYEEYTLIYEFISDTIGEEKASQYLHNQIEALTCLTPNAHVLLPMAFIAQNGQFAYIHIFHYNNRVHELASVLVLPDLSIMNMLLNLLCFQDGSSQSMSMHP